MLVYTNSAGHAACPAGSMHRCVCKCVQSEVSTEHVPLCTGVCATVYKHKRRGAWSMYTTVLLDALEVCMSEPAMPGGKADSGCALLMALSLCFKHL